VSSGFFFPDTTVFINFSIIREMDLLEGLLQGRGCWTAAVHAECEYSARLQLPGQDDLPKALAFMPDPIMPNRRQIMDAVVIRQAIADPTDPDTASLGEAQTISVITTTHIGSIFLTDDGDAEAYAVSEGIVTYRTTDLLGLAVRAKKLDQQQALDHIDTLVRADRKRISKRRFLEMMQPSDTGLER
jgi:predicted nucleic acid-binding protein